MANPVSFSLIGPGTVGRALSRGLVKYGWRLSTVVGIESAAARRFAAEQGAVWSRAPGQLTGATGLILIAVPDSELPGVAKSLAKLKLDWRKIVALHVSGAVGAEVLAPLERLGAGVGSCHPFQTFPARGRPPRLEGITFGIDGNERGLKAARKLVRALGGKSLEIKGQDRVLYHLAAVFACGMLTTNLQIAQTLLTSLGVSKRRALEAILPISSETLSNIKELGIERAMTGPAVRGDEATIRKHLRELKKLDPELAKIYKVMSEYLMTTLR